MTICKHERAIASFCLFMFGTVVLKPINKYEIGQFGFNPRCGHLFVFKMRKALNLVYLCALINKVWNVFSLKKNSITQIHRFK